ncbi:hypothetical protein VPH35_047734 [Triticum aestivum]
MKKIPYSQECELTCFHFPDVGAEVIDADYRDPMGVVLFNNSEADFAVKPGDRVIQMIVQVIAMPEVAEVEDLDITVWRSSRWRTSTPPSRGCRGGGPRRHRPEVAKVKDLDSLVDTSREVVMLGWWWNVREGTYLSVTVVCV